MGGSPGAGCSTSHFFLACLSTKSVEKRGYLQKEFKKALDLWQEKLDSDIYLIPVRLDECQVPEAFRDFQWANLYEKDGWWALLRAIQKGVGRQGLPLPKGLVDLPLALSHRRTRTGSPWLLAGLAAIVVVIRCYRLRSQPYPTETTASNANDVASQRLHSRSDGRASSCVDAADTDRNTSRHATPGITSIPTPTSTVPPKPPTPTSVPPKTETPTERATPTPTPKPSTATHFLAKCS